MTVSVPSGAPVVLVRGSDAVLVNEAVVAVQHQLVGDDDPSLVLEVLGPERLIPPDRDPDLGPLVDAAATPPFLTERRIVVGRGLARFSKKDAVAPLVAYLADPLPTTVLVLVWERPAGGGGAGAGDGKEDGDVKGDRRGGIPKSLTAALEAAGAHVIDTDPEKKVGEWVQRELRDSPLRLERDAVALLVEHIGEDAGALPGIVSALVGAHGEGASLGAADVEPYLGGSGGVPPWALTDAIDAGDVGGALEALDRLLRSGRHPLAVMATLHTHYQRILGLDGAGVADEKAAAAVLGMKGATYPARKALEQGRRMGPDLVREYLELLAAADLDLKGRRAFGWPGGGEAVMEVLVARLASRAPRRGARSGAARGGRR